MGWNRPVFNSFDPAGPLQGGAHACRNALAQSGRATLPTARQTTPAVSPLFLFAGRKRRLPACSLLAWRRGDGLDFFLFGFLGFPIASLLAFGHVDLPWLMMQYLVEGLGRRSRQASAQESRRKHQKQKKQRDD
jgi:hypothetical protein